MLFLCQDICFSKSHLVLQGPEQATDGKQSAGSSSPSSCLTVVSTGAYALSLIGQSPAAIWAMKLSSLHIKYFRTGALIVSMILLKPFVPFPLRSDSF